MADDEDAVAAACTIVTIFTDEQINKTDQSQRSVYAGFQRRIEHCAISRLIPARAKNQRWKACHICEFPAPDYSREFPASVSWT